VKYWTNNGMEPSFTAERNLFVASNYVIAQTPGIQIMQY